MKSLDLQTLYNDYGSEIRHYLRARFGEGPPEPEDVVQAAFAKLAAFADPASVDNPRAFLYAAARNIAIDEHRKATRRRAQHQQMMSRAAEENLDDLTPERVLLSKERLATLRAAVAELPAVEREVLLMRRFKAMSYAAIGERLGLSETSVRRHVATAMARLLDALKAADKRARGRTNGAAVERA
ncbi:MAG: sigma-70 family RNA polymerase sigma factor [Maricaulaceae bacterium]|jgi:RNA polymerase sigma-70 factor (ECF subfamily)